MCYQSGISDKSAAACECHEPANEQPKQTQILQENIFSHLNQHRKHQDEPHAAAAKRIQTNIARYLEANGAADTTTATKRAGSKRRAKKFMTTGIKAQPKLSDCSWDLPSQATFLFKLLSCRKSSLFGSTTVGLHQRHDDRATSAYFA